MSLDSSCYMAALTGERAREIEKVYSSPSDDSQNEDRTVHFRTLRECDEFGVDSTLFTIGLQTELQNRTSKISIASLD